MKFTLGAAGAETVSCLHPRQLQPSLFILHPASVPNMDHGQGGAGGPDQGHLTQTASVQRGGGRRRGL
uniref:Uncharacterized protein n=1 Tax=Knipowitschia caucasica TaxID=637954 RepID=A0AAV2LMX8_KNICA